ncbi:MAG: GNAT family protein [Alphaproteobacteria bacterium]|nr:GNAT family protein [Alphaproteobacteria bacterium]
MTTITTARLSLRPLRETDAGDIVRQLNNFAVSRWTARVPFPYSTLDAEDFLRRSAALPAGNWVAAIAARETDRLIGVIGCEAQDPGEAELGYWIGENHWGKGYGREAAAAMADHAFAVLGQEALVASYHVGNAASQRILEGLGFRRTGEGRSHSLARNAEVDLVLLRLDAKDRRP